MLVYQRVMLFFFFFLIWFVCPDLLQKVFSMRWSCTLGAMLIHPHMRKVPPVISMYGRSTVHLHTFGDDFRGYIYIYMCMYIYISVILSVYMYSCCKICQQHEEFEADIGKTPM